MTAHGFDAVLPAQIPCNDGGLSYGQIIEVAEAYEITVTIEVHGYFTTHPDRMAEMLAFCDSPYLRMNMDTGNTFIAGQDPVAGTAPAARRCREGP